MIKNMIGKYSIFIDNAPISDPEKKRLKQYSIFAFVAFVNMVVFGIINGLKNNYYLCLLILVSGICLVSGWYLLGKLRNGSYIYRLNMALYTVLILYMFAKGGEGGSMLLWGYTIPLISFHLFDKNEGLFWSSLVLVCTIILYFNPFNWQNMYVYHDQVVLRYAVTFLIVSIYTSWFEYHKNLYQSSMEETNRELKEALENVERLEGFLPICASCRKIRDDQGYWNQLEAYLKEHSDLKFSHSICPDCTKSLYPNITIPGDHRGE